MQAELFEEPPQIVGGRMKLKERPGLGLTLSPRAVYRRQLLEMGAEPVGNTPAQMAAQIYGALARQIRLVVD